MKIIIEAQGACGVNPRGLNIYTIETIKALLKRSKYNYSLAFFDYLGERNNRKTIEDHFAGFNVDLIESRDMHYVFLNYELAYAEKSFNDYIKSDADVFHIPWVFHVPGKIKGRSVVTVHDLIPILPIYGVLQYSEPSIEFSYNLKRIKNINATVIAISHATKADIVKYTDIPEEKIHVVYCGINHDIHFPQKNEEAIKQLGATGRFFLCIGMMSDYRKNFERIVKAFEHVAEKNNDVTLVSTGASINPNIKKLVSESKFKDRIILLPYVSDDQKRWLLSSTEALLYPSLYEGFGLPVVEAMACGAPSITSNITSMPEAAGNAAILVDPYSIENMAHEMERILNNPSLRDELIPKGLAHSAKFTWERAAEETEKVYEAANA